MNSIENFKYKFESTKYRLESARVSYQAGVRGLIVYRVFCTSFEAMEPYLQRSLIVMCYSLKHRVLLDQPVFAGMIWPSMYETAMTHMESVTLESLCANVLATIEGDGENVTFSEYVPPVLPVVMNQDAGLIPRRLISPKSKQKSSYPNV